MKKDKVTKIELARRWVAMLLTHHIVNSPNFSDIMKLTIEDYVPCDQQFPTEKDKIVLRHKTFYIKNGNHKSIISELNQLRHSLLGDVRLYFGARAANEIANEIPKMIDMYASNKIQEWIKRNPTHHEWMYS